MHVAFIIILILLSPLPFTSPFVYDDQDISVNRAYGVENNATQILAINTTQGLLVSPTSSIIHSAEHPLRDPRGITTVTVNDAVYALVAASANDVVQIINITNPSFPFIVSTIRDDFDTLDNPQDITTITLENTTYALIVSQGDGDGIGGGVQIINITDPSSPSAVSSVNRNTPGFGRLVSYLTAITTVTLNDTVYALITADIDSGVLIINITDPSSPSAIFSIYDNRPFNTLSGPRDIIIVTLNDTVYALVASFGDRGIQIINITDPSSPSAVSGVNDNTPGFGKLGRPVSITAVTLENATYALVADEESTNRKTDDFHIINITDPSSPSAVYSVRDNNNGFDALSRLNGITVVTLENATYALVASYNDNGIQIINITDPSSPSAVSKIEDEFYGFNTLKQSFAITTVTLNGTLYALVTSFGDDGIQIIKFESKQKALSINSNNHRYSGYAKAGDTLTVKFTVNGTIDDGSATILGLNASSNFIDKNFTASIIVPNTEHEGYANFRAVVKNNQTSSLVVTQNDLSDRNVFVDTIRPSITLIGDADYTVFVDTNPYPFIPGAFSSDGDPNYSNDVFSYNTGSLSTTGILTTTGSVMYYTYTADGDRAGNPGEIVRRSVTVIEHNPINITALTVNSTNLVNSTNYAKAGDTVRIQINTVGTNIASITGNILGGNFTHEISENGRIIHLNKTIEQNDTNGNLTFNIHVANSTNNVISVTQNDLTGGNIIIDTIAPNITLNGANNTHAEFGQTYMDPGATATDASYASNMIITSDTVVDTSTLDTYEISYKAPDDPAGNLGPIITRIVTVSETILPMLDSLNITSNNDNPAYAKAGDLVTITLIADEIISNVTVKIANITTINTIQNNTLYANYTVPYGQNGPVAFNITAYFISNLTLAVNASDLDSANIIIDTEKPLITLSGPLNSAIIVNQNYTDYNVTVTDNDLLYTGTVSSNVSSLNVSIIGENTITYTAPADNAGNVPNNATRTITITVSGIVVDVFSDNAYSSNLAKSGDLITVKITSDSYAGSTFTSATILGRSADTTLITGNTIYANITVQNGDTNGNTTFAITLDKNGTTSTINHDAITSTYVVVDTKAPTINSSTTLTPYLGSVTFDESVAITEYIDFAVDITGSSPTSFNLKDGSVIPKSILEITISQSTPFESNSKPEIKFDITSDYAEIIDLAGNSLSSITITASDGIGPSIKDATVVSSNLIEVYFDEDVQFISGKTPLQSLVIDGSLTFISSSISGNTLGISQILSPFSHAALNINFTEASSNIEDTSGNSFTSSSILTNNTQSSGPYISTDRIIVIPYNTRINIATLDVSDYTVSYGLITDATIDSIALSNDDTTVTLTMVSPFGTGTTPFIEQSGDILNILGNSVNLARTSTQDLAPPVLVYALSTTPTEIILTFSEPITGPSGNSVNYAIIGAEIRDITKIGSNTVLISASPFISAIVQTAPLSSIQDFSGNIAERGTNQNVFKIS